MSKKEDVVVDSEKKEYVAKLFLHSTWELDKRDTDLLTNAAAGKFDNVKRGILEDNANVNAQITWRDGYTPLHYAVQDSDNRMAEFLLEQDADPNIQECRMRFTALHMAARTGNADLITLLLKKGADPNIEDVDGNNASYWAQESGKFAILKIPGMPPPKSMTAEERFDKLQQLRTSRNPPKEEPEDKKGKGKGKKKK